MPTQTMSRKLTALVAMAALSTSLTTPACGVADEPSTRRSALELDSQPLDGGAGDNTFSELPFDTDDYCATKRIWFHGQCRDVSYFARFLDEGGVLKGVAGPRRKTAASDTGVIVLQGLGQTAVQHLFVSPDRLEGDGIVGQQQGYRYRSNFPIVGIQTFTFWKDSDGFNNIFSLLQGPVTMTSLSASGLPTQRTVFGTVRWTHWVETASSYKQLNSDGSILRVSAATSAQVDDATCEAKAAAANSYVVDQCYINLEIETLAIIAIGAAVAGGILLTTEGVGAPVSAIVMGAAGGWAAVHYNSQSKICDALADEAKAEARPPASPSSRTHPSRRASRSRPSPRTAPSDRWIAARGARCRSRTRRRTALPATTAAPTPRARAARRATTSPTTRSPRRWSSTPIRRSTACPPAPRPSSKAPARSSSSGRQRPV